jgi:DHHC palmitoyltransferase
VAAASAGQFLNLYFCKNLRVYAASAIAYCWTEPLRCSDFRVQRCRFDHHCGWLNSCVGEGNYRYFLLFLGTHCCMLWYGTALIGSAVATIADSNKLWSAQFKSADTGVTQSASAAIVLQWFMYHHGRLCAVGILALAMGAVLTGFTLYHCLLLARGTTTNEDAKWRDAKHFHKQLLRAWKRKERDEAAAAATAATVDITNADGSTGSAAAAAAAAAEKGAKSRKQSKRKSAAAAAQSNNSSSSSSSSAVREEQQRASTNDAASSSSVNTGSSDAQAMSTAAEAAATGDVDGTADDAAAAEEEPLRHPGALPANMYNNGAWSNLLEVLLPRCERRRNRKMVPKVDPFAASEKSYWVK